MEFKLNVQQKKSLLSLARKVVEASVRGRAIPDEKTDDPQLMMPLGCFVTLHVSGELRGCIGTFQAQRPLFETIKDMAKAALQDSRFIHNRIGVSELSKLEIEISVLSPLTKTDDPLSLELGKHGIYITQDYASGCFLPQVATETGWSKEEFLGYCCSHKAGLPADAWQEAKTSVYLFTAEVFNESEM